MTNPFVKNIAEQTENFWYAQEYNKNLIAYNLIKDVIKHFVETKVWVYSADRNRYFVQKENLNALDPSERELANALWFLSYDPEKFSLPKNHEWFKNPTGYAGKTVHNDVTRMLMKNRILYTAYKPKRFVPTFQSMDFPAMKALSDRNTLKVWETIGLVLLGVVTLFIPGLKNASKFAFLAAGTVAAESYLHNAYVARTEQAYADFEGYKVSEKVHAG